MQVGFRFGRRGGRGDDDQSPGSPEITLQDQSASGPAPLFWFSVPVHMSSEVPEHVPEEPGAGAPGSRAGDDLRSTLAAAGAYPPL